MAIIDTILNYTLPPAIIIVLLWWLYKIFKPMFQGLGKAFGGVVDKVKGESQETQQVKNIVYE